MGLTITRPEVAYPPGWKPVLVVVVDTEEEFDWSLPLDRNSTSVRAMAAVDCAQRIFDQYGVRPTYAIDYPVATQREGWAPLKEIHSSGRCEIGAHLHPWVNPPHEEHVNYRNSYTSNLPLPLAAAKLRQLGDAIGAAFGARPRSFKAGRYGISDAMVPILKEEGYEVDLSTAPPFDWRDDGGPDFTHSPLDCFWMGPSDPVMKAQPMLGIPTTGAFVGWANCCAPPLYRAVSGRLGRTLRAAGVMARLGMVDRLRLSPEGFTHQEHRKLTRFLLGRGVGAFTFSFHSPSLKPGHTEYVRSTAELGAFLDLFRRYFDFFFGELGGRAMTALELKRALA